MSGDLLGLLGHEVDQLRFDAIVEEGGFGFVYRGRHLGLDEPVAIKCLKPRVGDPALVESFGKRFRDETKIAYRLSQGNLDIVRSISSGTLTAPNGAIIPYMVLEWLEGHPLTEELFRRRSDANGGKMSITEAVEMLDSAAGAIAFAHSQGVVHRDIKPGNLFLSETRAGVRIKVLDFGLAKIIDPDGFMTPTAAQTGSNVFIASPSYGAPEQFGKKNGPIGPWTDVYSLALVLLEMLNGRKARAADNLIEGMMKALSPETASPTPRKLGLKVSDEVESVFQKATAMDGPARYKDAAEFWNALRDALMTMPSARDGMRTIVNPDAAREIRDQIMAAAQKKKTAPAAQTMALGSPSPTPTPAPAPQPVHRQERTLRLGTETSGQIPPAPPPTPKPFAGTALLQQPMRDGPPSSQPNTSPRMQAPQSVPRSQPRPSAKPRSVIPLWLALVVAAFLGAAGALAIVYAIKVAPKK